VHRDRGWKAKSVRTFTTFDAKAPWYRLREADGISGKGVLTVQLANGERSLLLTTTHLQAQYGSRIYHAERRAQLDQLVRVLGTPSDRPHLIAGDFNTTADEELYASHLASLGHDLTETERRQCASGTHFDPLDGRKKWIDYVFARNLPGEAQVVRIQNDAADDPYSDHDGLIVRWTLPDKV
jgi:endonuclease/exonuclease/phosphatase family metal-dependent hydrolase